MFRHYFFSLVFLFIISCNTLDLPDPPKVTMKNKADSIANQYITSKELVGFTAGILKNDKIIWQKGFGYSDVENEILADTTMVHRLASVTKPMTATAIMQLVDKGVLDLDEPIQKYLSDYPKKEEGEITIRNLLNHTSGTRTYRFISFENRPTKHYSSLLEGTKKFRNRGLRHTPGTKYFYTSYGYTILGAIIEEVTDKTYQDYMKENIWDPSGMTQTSTEVFGTEYPNKSKLYKKTGSGFKTDQITNLSIKYPAGGVQSTSGDMLRFANAMLNNELISKKSMESAFVVPNLEQEDRLPYGLGWIIEQHEKHGLIYYHDGHQSGTSTVLIISPSSQLAVVVLANSSESNQEVQSMGWELLNKYSKN